MVRLGGPCCLQCQGCEGESGRASCGVEAAWETSVDEKEEIAVSCGFHRVQNVRGVFKGIRGREGRALPAFVPICPLSWLA